MTDRRVVCGVCGYAIHGVAEQQHGDHPTHTDAELADVTARVDWLATRLAFAMYVRLWREGQNDDGRPVRGGRLRRWLVVG